jgi:hypothetical protein
MCYFLRLASPLTLSEVRAMLPPGLTADGGTAAELAWLRGVLPAAQTAAHLRVGGCACDLVRPRDPDQRTDERHLRERYFRLGLRRETIVAELERHRRPPPTPPPEGWPRALAGFVAEHGRNAGPTVYELRFGPAADAAGPPDLTRATALPLDRVQANPDGWLAEGHPIVVSRG